MADRNSLRKAVTTRLRFYINFAGDGTFTLADEITEYVRDSNWTIGMSEPYQLVADESRLELTLINTDKRFSPEYSEGPYYGNLKPQRLVKVVAEQLSGSSTTLYLGYIDRISPATLDGKTCYITAVSPKQYIQEQRIYLPLLKNVTADEIIEAILDRVHLPPSTGDVWQLGIAGSSELGETTTLSDLSVGRDLDSGNTTFAYVADTWDADFQGNQYVSNDWQSSFKGYTAIADVVEAELGRFYWSRAGLATFRARDWLQLKKDSSESYTAADFIESRYQYGARIYNMVSVMAYPRVVSETDEIVYESNERFDVRRDDTKSLRVRYASDEGYELAAEDPYVDNITLVPGSQPAQYSVVWDARGAEFEFRANASSGFNYAHTNLRIKAKTVKSYNPYEAMARDGQSVSDYGLRPLTIDSKLTESQNLAQSIAEYRLNQYKNPKGELLYVEMLLDNDQKWTEALAYGVGTRIRISDSSISHEADYFIIGEMYSYRLELYHKVRWYLERADSNQAWLLGETGYSELGETAYLGV